MSVDRLAEIAARTPSVFDTFFLREDEDIERRPHFRMSVDVVAAFDDMRASYLLPFVSAEDGTTTLQTTLQPSFVMGGTISMSGTTNGTESRGWRFGIDTSQVSLSPDAETLEQQKFEVPDSASWSYANTLAYASWFDRDRGITLSGGYAFRMTPVSTTSDTGQPVFSLGREDGDVVASKTEIGGFVHVGWSTVGEVALTVMPDGIGQLVYRRPFQLERADGAGPLLGVIPALQQVRAGAYIAGYNGLSERVRLDAEAMMRHEAGQAVGFDHTSVEVELWLKKASSTLDPNYRSRKVTRESREVLLRARGSAWSLSEGLVPGGAAEVAWSGFGVGRRGDIGFSIGGAWNDYRSLTLLPLTDMSLMTIRIEGGF